LAIVLLPSLFNVLTFGQESFTLNISLKFPMDFESNALINNLKIADAELSYVYEISIFGGDYSATNSSTSTVLSLGVSQQGLYEISASVMAGKDTYFKRCGYSYSRLQFFNSGHRNSS
jgi:stage II sporulation protein D